METAEFPCLLFVYGSLKRGYELHDELTRQRFLNEATTTPNFRLFNCGTYPGMVKVVSEGRSVKGEVYGVTSACLDRLDQIEGVSEGYYIRTHIPLMAPFDAFEVWGYLYQQPTEHLPDCGDEWP